MLRRVLTGLDWGKRHCWRWWCWWWRSSWQLRGSADPSTTSTTQLSRIEVVVVISAIAIVWHIVITVVATAVVLIRTHIVVITNTGPSTANATHFGCHEIIVIVRTITISFNIVIAMITSSVRTSVGVFATTAILTGCGNWWRGWRWRWWGWRWGWRRWRCYWRGRTSATNAAICCGMEIGIVKSAVTICFKVIVAVVPTTVSLTVCYIQIETRRRRGRGRRPTPTYTAHF